MEGYTNKLNNQIYTNATAQTNSSFLNQQYDNCHSNKTSCWTQTKVEKQHKSQQTRRHQWTQSSQLAHFRGAKTLTAKPYETAEDRAVHLVRQVIIIQKYWRGHLARKLCRRLKEDERKLLEKKLCQLKLKRNVGPSRDIHEKLLEGKFSSRRDFDVLNEELREWKQEQMVQLMNNVPRWDERGRRLAIRWLVDKEAHMLALIGQHKRMATKQKQQRITDHLLTMVSRAKKWVLPSGREVVVVTPVILHMQQMRDIYYRLQQQPNCRLDILKQITRVLNNIEQKPDTLLAHMIEEILRLVEREVEMIRSKMPMANCLGLRLRLRHLILRYIFIVFLVQQTQQSFETEVEWEVGGCLKNGRCFKCGRFKPLVSTSRCESCQKGELTSSKCEKDDYSIWLRCLQKRERELSDDSNGPAFILKKDDIKYLAEKVWMRKSVLSGVEDFNQLQFCRWEPNEVWSPWNCVLLTRDEAWLHQNIAHHEKHYDPIFVRKIRYRQMLGLQRFSQNQN